MNFIKKQGIATWLSAAVVILGLVSLIIYVANGASVGYFKDTTNAAVVTMTIFAIILVVGGVVLAQLKFDGTLGVIIKTLSGACVIGAAILLIASLLVFVGDRSQGLAYIFGSDENTLSEIQTKDNMSSAYTAIVGFVFYGITWLCAVVASFFRFVKD